MTQSGCLLSVFPVTSFVLGIFLRHFTDMPYSLSQPHPYRILTGSFALSFFFFFFKFYFIFKLYITVLVLPNIKMNPPQVYMCSPSWTLLPPPSLFHPSGSSQCTSPKHPVSCIEPGLATHFIHDILHVSMPFSQIFPFALSWLWQTDLSLLAQECDSPKLFWSRSGE